MGLNDGHPEVFTFEWGPCSRSGLTCGPARLGASGQRSSARIAQRVNGTIEPVGPALSVLNGAIGTLHRRRRPLPHVGRARLTCGLVLPPNT
jgi:hypothetical protein